MKRGVIIVAGGTGQRMGSEIPKQFLELNGKPIIAHALDKFLLFDPFIKVVVVLASSHRKYWDTPTLSGTYDSRVRITDGGKTRYESVKNGLALMEDGRIVGIHDAVRPLVSLGTLERTYESAEKSGSGIPVVKVEETIRMVKGVSRSVHLNRSQLRRVQTPQVFQSEMIKEAYNQPFDKSFTDDASIFETGFGEVFLVEGNRENIKITNPADLQLASILILSKE